MKLNDFTVLWNFARDMFEHPNFIYVLTHDIFEVSGFRSNLNVVINF